MSSVNAKDAMEAMYTDKRNISEIRFPSDLATEGTGNVIRFNINIPSGSKYLSSGEYREQLDTNGNVITPEFSSPDSFSLQRRFSRNYIRTATVIDLFMPAQIRTNYSSDWGQETLGLLGAATDAGKGLAEIENWDRQAVSDIWQIAKQTLGVAMINTLAGTLDTLTPFNVSGLRKVAMQTMVNPYVEVVFNGISNRTFSFTFKMIPKSKEEQILIKRIVDEFKFHRAPEMLFGNQNNYWLPPSLFDIQFLNREGENPWIYKISTCALTNLSVDKSPEGNFVSRADGSPFATEITLEFMEMEQLTKERIKKGY